MVRQQEGGGETLLQHPRWIFSKDDLEFHLPDDQAMPQGLSTNIHIEYLCYYIKHRRALLRLRCGLGGCQLASFLQLRPPIHDLTEIEATRLLAHPAPLFL